MFTLSLKDIQHASTDIILLGSQLYKRAFVTNSLQLHIVVFTGLRDL